MFRNDFNPSFPNFNAMNYVPPQYHSSLMRTPSYHIGQQLGGDALGSLFSLGSRMGGYDSYRPSLMQTLGSMAGIGVGLAGHLAQRDIPQDPNIDPEEMKYRKFTGLGVGKYGADYDPFDYRSSQAYSQWAKDKQDYLTKKNNPHPDLVSNNSEESVEPEPKDEYIRHEGSGAISGGNIHSFMDREPLHDLRISEDISQLKQMMDAEKQARENQEEELRVQSPLEDPFQPVLSKRQRRRQARDARLEHFGDQFERNKPGDIPLDIQPPADIREPFHLENPVLQDEMEKDLAAIMEKEKEKRIARELELEQEVENRMIEDRLRRLGIVDADRPRPGSDYSIMNEYMAQQKLRKEEKAEAKIQERIFKGLEWMNPLKKEKK